MEVHIECCNFLQNWISNSILEKYAARFIHENICSIWCIGISCCSPISCMTVFNRKSIWILSNQDLSWTDQFLVVLSVMNKEQLWTDVFEPLSQKDIKNATKNLSLLFGLDWWSHLSVILKRVSPHIGLSTYAESF